MIFGRNGDSDIILEKMNLQMSLVKLGYGVLCSAKSLFCTVGKKEEENVGI